jgi:hypothetical protein
MPGPAGLNDRTRCSFDREASVAAHRNRIAADQPATEGTARSHSGTGPILLDPCDTRRELGPGIPLAAVTRHMRSQ